MVKECHTWNQSATEHDRFHMCRNNTVHIYHAVCSWQLFNHQQFEDLQKQRIPTFFFGEVIHFAIHKAYTWSESCLQSMCACETLWEAVKRASEGEHECAFDCCCCPTKNAWDVASGQTLQTYKVFFLVFNMFVIPEEQWKEDLWGTLTRTWKWTLTGLLPGDGDL